MTTSDILECDKECSFKKQLYDIENSYYKFRERDLEIKRACHYCRHDIDKNKCLLNQIYEKTYVREELNKLLDEINNRKQELACIQEQKNDIMNNLNAKKNSKLKEINDLSIEIDKLDKKATKYRAKDFLISTIGEKNYISYMNNGYFDVIGTNGAIYRIAKGGYFSKRIIETKKGILYKIKDYIYSEFLPGYDSKKYYIEYQGIYQGKIKPTVYPLEDAIAIIYMNIMKDSDRFDRDKACGTICV